MGVTLGRVRLRISTLSQISYKHLNRPTLLDTSQPYKMAIGEVNMSDKRYTEEFKFEAIRQVVDRGYSIAEVADRLGTTTHSLYA